MEAMRQTWTDDRMDDLVGHVDSGFAQAHDDNKELRREMVGLGNELRRENKALVGEFREDNKAIADELRLENRLLRTEMNRRFDTLQTTLLGAILAGFISFLIAHFA